MQISQSTFLITGGASGLGASCAREFVRSGGNVVICDLNREAGQAMTRELGPKCLFLETDVTSETHVQKAVDLAIEKLGQLHGAICCAGIAIAEKILNKEGQPHKMESFKKSMDTNVLGTFNVIRLASAAMAKLPPGEQGERGCFIGTASIAAFEGQWGQTAYAASKGAIVAMTLPVARELSVLGIRMATIAPGIFDTPMLAGLSDKVRESLGQQVPFPSRLGRPDEYARTARFIVENPMINGTVIRLDGAMRMGAR